MLAKIKKLICIVVLVAALISTQAAALLETMYDPPHYFVGNMRINDVASSWNWFLTTYFNGYTDNMDDKFVATGTLEVYGVFMSRIQPETFYSFTVPVEITDEIQLESGDILPTATQWFNVVPAEYFSEIEPSNGTRYTFTGDPLSLLNPDMYKMYFDENQGLIHVVFYLTESYVEEHKELLEHVYLVLSLGQSVVINERPDNIIYGQTEVLPTGIYTQLLNDIVKKLDAIQSQGNGLTEIQVQRAIMNALNERAASEYQQSSGYASNAMDNVSNEVASVGESLLNSGMLGAGAQISSIFDLSQRAILTVPTIKIPAIGDIVPEMVLFESQNYDITEMLDSMIPETIINLVRVINTILLLTYICKEVYGIFVRFLNGGENVV